MTARREALELIRVARELVAEAGDNVIAQAFNGRVTISGRAKGSILNANFLIVCDHGDWSGFMPLRDALKRIDEVAARSPNKYYAVVER